MHKALTAALALLYPQRCLGCKALVGPEESFCTGCRRFLQIIESPLCLCCGAPFATSAGSDHLCSRCQARPPAFRQARSWACYQSGETSPRPLSEAIQHFKYHRNLSTGKALAALGAMHFPLASQEYDLIVPVPLHLERLRWRGFNQSLILSRAIGRARQIAVDPFLLERTRPTVPQTQLNESERRANVRGAFVVVAPERLEGERVLLVDDVYTSGATVEECARALCRGGAAVVDVFTLARAVSH
ncbi:MAG: ComF family protein [Deltaproteobacteria bacterium]|nr:ComF family protein [Deltaproteobacteria bacterium]